MRRAIVQRVATQVFAILVVVLAVVAGVGFCYLLRGVGVLDVGPAVRGALPLQQLAGDAAQPLARVLLAWLPAGLVAGIAAACWARGARAAVAFVVSGALLVAGGAASDAVAVSDPFGSHLGSQVTRPGNLVAVACFVSGSLVARRRRVDPPAALRPAASVG